ncbi:MAG: HAD family hydrolase [Rhodospirillaceae bacterium]
MTALPEGVRAVARAAPCTPPRPGLILDRDGVVVVEVNYLSRPEDVVLERGAVDLLRLCAARGIPVGVATNQSGIDRKYFDWAEYDAVAARLDALLAEHGIAPLTTAACAFHAKHTPGWGPTHDHWRKPGPGMCLWLAEALGLDLARSWLVGDKASDLMAARAAGMAGAIHVLTGHGRVEREKALAVATETFPVLTADSLADVAALVEMGRLPA